MKKINKTPEIIPQNNDELTKRGTIRKRKPKTKNTYFTEATEDAIVEYVSLVDQEKRDKIFNEKIDYAFHKLAENIIHTFKFYYTDVDTMSELKHEVVTFLLSKLHLYNKSKGKAFSYFGTIAKRYLILYNMKNYSRIKEKADLTEVDDDKTITNDIINSGNSKELGTFIDLYTQYNDKNLLKIFNKPHEQKIADSVIELFKKRESLDVFNKKALFIYTREITDATTPQISKVIKRLKGIYLKLYNEFYETGDVDMNRIV